MSTALNPCSCGYEGALAGMNNGTHLSLTCPCCGTEAAAFTMAGLVDAWNATAEGWTPNTTGRCPWPADAKIDVRSAKHEAYNVTNAFYLACGGRGDVWALDHPDRVLCSRLAVRK